MGDYLNTKLDADQVLRRAYDEAENRLRVDAEVTAVIGTVDVVINAATDNIAISDGTDFLAINADGSINVNVSDIVISAANDSIKIGDGTDFLEINTDGSINVRIGDGVNQATTTKAKTGTVVGLDISSKNELFSKPFTQLTVLTKNDDGDPLTIKSIHGGVDVQLMTITYDTDGDFQDANVTDL